MLEKTLVTKMLRLLRANGAWAEKVHGSALQRRGLPDIIGCYRGLFFSIEVKVWPNQPTEIQRTVMTEVLKAGGLAIVAWSTEDVDALILRMQEIANG